MVVIEAVEPGGIGDELGIEAGDRLLAINGRPVRDLIDVQLEERGEQILLEVEKADGTLWDLEIEKETEDRLGLQLEHPEPTQCGNNCLFCFVHQLPRGLRRSLYVKDEDYRFSFLYGAYVTLTNLAEADLARIIEQRLSPLYVSVHATEEQLRTRLLGRQGPPVLDLLQRLTAAGIVVHTQVVLCPGVNDGEDLERTLADLYALSPGVRSLAVVPVGLTGYRQRLPQLRRPTAPEAAALIDLVQGWQRRALEEKGSRFVFAADEFFLQANRPFPPLVQYEDLPQLENGVGMIPLFRQEAAEALAEAEPLAAPGVGVAVVTGESAAAEVRHFAAALAERTGLAIEVHVVRNLFFGGQVSVAGLLAGADIVEQLRGKPLGSTLLIPEVMLKEGEDIFLDDLSLIDLERQLGVPVRSIASTPWGLLEALEELAAAVPPNQGG